MIARARGAFALAAALVGCGTPGPGRDENVDALAEPAGDAASIDAASEAALVDLVPADTTDDVADATADGTAPMCTRCDAYSQPTSGGVIDNAALTEVSGVVASRAHPGVLYVHNDSGDTPRFFAIDMAGHTLGEFRLAGAAANDWEDISLGPCESGTCVYLGDVGDNLMTRSQYQMYRVAEPDVAVGRDVGVVTVPFERFPFVYPDGSHNCETLMVHPSTGRTYLVTKVEDGASEVFRFPMPLRADTEVTLERVTGFMVPAAGNLTTTGGDIHPCANRFLLRVYGRLYEYRVDDARPFEEVFDAAANVVPVASEIQGEAVAYLPDGHGYVTISEGMARPVNANGCR